MPQAAPCSKRRRSPRRQIRGRLSVELRSQGSDDERGAVLARGRLADISCSGLKCSVDLEVPTGTHVGIGFPGVLGTDLGRRGLGGHIVRTESLDGATGQVVVEFAHPLEDLDVDIIETAGGTTPLGGRPAASRRASWADEPSPFPFFCTGSLR